MKLTDLLKLKWNKLGNEILSEISDIYDDFLEEDFKLDFGSEDCILKLLDVMDKFFEETEYTYLESILDFITLNFEITKDEEETEDKQKEIYRRYINVKINNDVFETAWYTGYYTYPMTNLLKLIK